MTKAIMYSTRYYDGRPRRIFYPSRRHHTVELEEFGGEDDREVQVFEDIGSFSVFEQTEEGAVLYTAFPAAEYPGLIILGDYFRLGAKQMVIWW